MLSFDDIPLPWYSILIPELSSQSLHMYIESCGVPSSMVPVCTYMGGVRDTPAAVKQIGKPMWPSVSPGQLFAKTLPFTTAY